MKIKTEDLAAYAVTATPSNEDDDVIIARALAILSNRMRRPEAYISSPQDVKDYLRLKIGLLEHESFQCVFLDAQNGVISVEEMSRGTLTQASVYPREIVKAALARNACSVILSHNHPSGKVEPSNEDRAITGAIKSALALVDVRVLDHIIVSGDQAYSFAEHFSV